MTRKPDGTASPRERGLRCLATDGRDHIDANLRQGLVPKRTPSRTTKALALEALARDVADSMPRDTTIEQRVDALWRLISAEVDAIELPNERAALTAALHLDPANREPSIDARLAFARDRGDFGTKSAGRRHGYDALRRWWGDGIRLLAAEVDARLKQMRVYPENWSTYFAAPTYRRPSKGAQPVFVELFVVTIFMSGRSVERRVTERLVTAREDNVQFYVARALPEMDDLTGSVPVRALWGCTEERLPAEPGEPILTRLWFPAPLRSGERHFFASESVVTDKSLPARRAINVEVDHHGIAPGRRMHDVLPIQGLTIRIRFDRADLPDAVWWYADVTTRERYRPPEPDDDRWVPVTSQGFAEHTFAEPCQPLANYGLAIGWPSP